MAKSGSKTQLNFKSYRACLGCKKTIFTSPRFLRCPKCKEKLKAIKASARNKQPGGGKRLAVELTVNEILGVELVNLQILGNNSSDQQFLKSLKRQYREKGTLSPKQWHYARVLINRYKQEKKTKKKPKKRRLNKAEYSELQRVMIAKEHI